MECQSNDKDRDKCLKGLFVSAQGQLGNREHIHAVKVKEVIINQAKWVTIHMTLKKMECNNKKK